MDDLQKLRKQCIHYHKQKTNDIDGRKGGGTLEEWDELKEKLSHLNIIYAAQLYVLDDEMFDVWQNTLDDRGDAKSINGMIGLELERIMSIANTYKIETDELNRFVAQQQKWWVICPHQNAEGVCRKNHCRHLHGPRRDP